VSPYPLTMRQIRLKATAKTEQQARIELGRLLKEASEGRTPESAATVAKLLEEYAAIAPWDMSSFSWASQAGLAILMTGLALGPSFHRAAPPSQAWRKP
jgi:hypothetical protein